jgi:GNAT superfamily N-acetyltransferase
MEIAVSTMQDIPQLCGLLNELFAQEAEFAPNAGVQEKGLAEIISSPQVGDILIARKEGVIVGMLNFLYTVSTALGGRVALLEDMVVSPGFRGQSIGSELMRHAIEHAKQQRCKRITLLTDDDNKGAHKFYELCGFSRSTMVPFRLNIEIDSDA